MRLFSLCLLGLAFDSVSAGVSKPEIFVGVNRDSLEKGIVGALEPTVKWQTSTTVADCDLEGGFEMTVSDPSNMPYSVWGRIKKTIGKVNLSVRADTKSSSMNKFDLDLQASVADSKIQIEGKADGDDSTLSINKFKLTQGFDAAGGRLTLKPAYSIPARKGDLQLTYSVSDVEVTIDADMNKQKVSVQKALGSAAGTIKPSINTVGEFELEYKKPIGTGLLTSTYKPNKMVDLKYTDGPWEAVLSAPVDDLRNFDKRVNFKVSRAFDVTQ
ncbi:hypothetical protein ACA910_006952 [Epithemia clementina (nom. ined.)]